MLYTARGTLKREGFTQNDFNKMTNNSIMEKYEDDR